MRRVHLILLSATGALALTAGAAGARILPQTTPLAEAQLFISPSGQPFRSKPGEPYPVVVWFAKTDANHDGKIDRAEFKAEAEDFFHQLDIRKNGIIDDQIVGLYEKKVVPEILAGVSGILFRGGADEAKLIKVQSQIGQPGGPPVVEGQGDLAAPSAPVAHPQGAAGYNLLGDGEPLRSADRSFRGQIRLADMLAQADRNFDLLDDEHRGYLTLEDLPRTTVQLEASPARKR